MVTNGDIGGRRVCSNGDVTTVFFQHKHFLQFLLFSSHPLKLELNNLVVKTFKQANPNLTQGKKRAKKYYDTIKNKTFILKTLQTYHNFWYHYCS